MATAGVYSRCQKTASLQGYLNEGHPAADSQHNRLAPLPQTCHRHFDLGIIKQPQPFRRPPHRGTQQSPCHHPLTGRWEREAASLEVSLPRRVTMHRQGETNPQLSSRRLHSQTEGQAATELARKGCSRKGKIVVLNRNPTSLKTSKPPPSTPSQMPTPADSSDPPSTFHSIITVVLFDKSVTGHGQLLWRAGSNQNLTDLHTFERSQTLREVPDVWRETEAVTTLRERCFGELQASLPHFSFRENHGSSPIESHFWAHGDDDD
ncbi:hypothetical protein QYF61_018617 [Mycteria americana]|uniref:Uncharacterized protein n=1 Tax=Mycteria americana TaxID=33587 RepID=A0AAN7S8J7_MYCAM|nr:hypothetical protein QYF61_018617 [Mycteria americana]